VSDAALGLGEAKACIECEAGKILRRWRECAQAPLCFRFGLIARLVDARTFGCDRFNDGQLGGGELAGVVPGQVSGVVVAGALAQLQLFIERGGVQALRRLRHSARRRRFGVLPAIH